MLLGGLAVPEDPISDRVTVVRDCRDPVSPEPPTAPAVGDDLEDRQHRSSLGLGFDVGVAECVPIGDVAHTIPTEPIRTDGHAGVDAFIPLLVTVVMSVGSRTWSAHGIRSIEEL